MTDLKKFELGFPGTDLRKKLVDAVLRGEKTATAGLLSDLGLDGDEMPAVGESFLLVDNDDRGVGVVEITEIRVLRVGDCDLQFARDEGEGFTTVAEWREAHDRFWRSYADETRAHLSDPEWDVTDDTLFIATRFRLVERS